jgi:threonine dehydratase
LPLVSTLVDLEEIKAARERLDGVVTYTPCLYSRPFSQELGVSVYYKYETLQLTGSFKVRGAYNKIRSLAPAAIARGVVTASAGNHAQGVAFAAQAAGVRSIIVMPVTTPLVKVESTRRLGGGVVLAGRLFDESAGNALELAREEKIPYIPPFDDEQVIAGQGTIGLEIFEQVPDVEAVVVPVGGGGLISGVAAALKGLRPGIKVYGVQTEAAPAMAQSFRLDRRAEHLAQRSIADGITVKQPGEITFEHIRRLVDDIVTVSEDQIRAAINSLIETGKTVTEGAAAVTLAALQAGKLPQLDGKKAVLILSGANIDLAFLGRIIDRSLVENRRLMRFRTHVPDHSGELAAMLQCIADHGGNVLAIEHDRMFKQKGFWDAEVEVTLETRNNEHIEELQQVLCGHGYSIDPLD